MDLVRIIKSNKGSDMLVLNNFIYRKQKERGNTIY